MKDLKQVPLVHLANRLYEIDREIEELNKEHDEIIYTLWDMIPTLKDNKDMQPKVKVKEK